MTLERMDFNLLRVFDAVFEDRNLVLAGKRLNLTPPPVSLKGREFRGERFLARLVRRCDRMGNWSYNCRHEHAHSSPPQIRTRRIGR